MCEFNVEYVCPQDTSSIFFSGARFQGMTTTFTRYQASEYVGSILIAEYKANILLRWSTAL